MTRKLSPDEMLRRLDLIAERRGQARKRRREDRKAVRNPPAGRSADEDAASGSAEAADG